MNSSVLFALSMVNLSLMPRVMSSEDMKLLSTLAPSAPLTRVRPSKVFPMVSTSTPTEFPLVLPLVSLPSTSQL